MRCVNCDGTGVCILCEGSGFAPCRPCDGVGSLTIANRSGGMSSSRCPFCNGRGKIPCDPACKHCEGTGEITDAEMERKETVARFTEHGDYVSWKILAVNVLLFLAGSLSLLLLKKDYILQFCALNGSRVFAGEWWRMVTSIFVHLGFYHFVVNSIVLYAYCPPIEKTMGAPKFLSLYFFSGILGNLLTILLKPAIWSAGASGALFGVMGAYFGLQYHYRIFPRSLILRLAIVLAIEMLLGFLPGSRINVLAHMGGFLGGFLLSSIIHLDERS